MLTAVPNVKPSRLTGGGRSWLPFSAWVGEKPLVRSVLELMGHIGETRSWGLELEGGGLREQADTALGGVA